MVCPLFTRFFDLGKKGRKQSSSTEYVYPRNQTAEDIQLYTNGKYFFKHFFHEIQAAKKEVYILFFSVESDDFGKKFFQLLKETVQRGVDVYLLVDQLGSHQLKKSDERKLKIAGVRFLKSNRWNWLKPIRSLNQRNHRKIAVIDRQSAFIGGLNIGNKYINVDPEFTFWRDYHVGLTGTIVNDILHLFSTDWQAAGGKSLEIEPVNSRPGPHTCQLLPSAGQQLEERWYELISQAKHSIYIGSPYFILSDRLITLLEQRLSEGVSVTVLYPHEADHAFVKEASVDHLKRIHDQGGKIQLYTKGFFHAKIILVDEKVVDLGTANFDFRSLFINKEVNLIIQDENITQKFLEHYNQDCESGIPVYDDWWFEKSMLARVKRGIAKLMKPLL